MLLNEIVEGPLLKPKHEIETFGDLIYIFNTCYSKSRIFHDSHSIKVAPHDKCNKNCKKVDISASILAHLSSSALKLTPFVNP
jgi:hypothetical protein